MKTDHDQPPTENKRREWSQRAHRGQSYSCGRLQGMSQPTEGAVTRFRTAITDLACFPYLVKIAIELIKIDRNSYRSQI